MTNSARAGGCTVSNYPFFTSKERDNETGLDYFLARYYSSTQGRFTSPDEFTGGPDELYDFVDDAAENPTFYAELDNPQSLNKYQYTYNNPVNMVDPDGHCPPCFGPSISGVTDARELLSDPSRALDKLQLKISAIGIIPGAELADGVNAIISGLRGNRSEAITDGLGMAGPAFSAVATANRFRKIAKLANKAEDVIGGDVAIHGNSALSPKLQHVYELQDQAGDVKKVGLSGAKPKRDGSSPRAAPQVNRQNKNRSGTNRLSGVIVKKNVAGRRAGLDAERKQAEMRKKQGHSMELHKRP